MATCRGHVGVGGAADVGWGPGGGLCGWGAAYGGRGDRRGGGAADMGWGPCADPGTGITHLRDMFVK